VSRRPYLRAVIVVDVARVSDSCGYAVPRMDLLEERETLDRVWRTRDDARIATYHAKAERHEPRRAARPGHVAGVGRPGPGRPRPPGARRAR